MQKLVNAKQKKQEKKRPQIIFNFGKREVARAKPQKASMFTATGVGNDR